MNEGIIFRRQTSRGNEFTEYSPRTKGVEKKKKEVVIPI